MSLLQKYNAFIESKKDEIAADILLDLGFEPPYSDADMERAATMVNLVTNTNLDNIVKTVSKGDEVLEAKMIQDLIEDGVYVQTPESAFRKMEQQTIQNFS